MCGVSLSLNQVSEKQASILLILRNLGFRQSVQQFRSSKGKIGNTSKRYKCAKLPGKAKYGKTLKAIFILFFKRSRFTYESIEAPL